LQLFQRGTTLTDFPFFYAVVVRLLHNKLITNVLQYSGNKKGICLETNNKTTATNKEYALECPAYTSV